MSPPCGFHTSAPTSPFGTNAALFASSGFPTSTPTTSTFGSNVVAPSAFGNPTFGAIIPTFQPFGNNSTMPSGFWPPISGCQAPALESSSGSYMLVGLVPVYCHIPSVQPQSTPTGGTQGGNGGVSSGTAVGFNPFATSVPPPTTYPSSWPHCNCSQQRPPNNNTTYSTTTSNPTSVIPATTGPPFRSPFFSIGTEATIEGASFSFLPPTPTTTGGATYCGTPFGARTEATTGGTPFSSIFGSRTEVTTGGTPFSSTFGTPAEATTGGTPFPSTFGTPTEATTGGMPFPSTFGSRTEATTGGTLFPPSFGCVIPSSLGSRTEATTGATPSSLFISRTEATTGGMTMSFESAPPGVTTNIGVRCCGLLPTPTEATIGGTSASFSFTPPTEGTTRGWGGLLPTPTDATIGGTSGSFRLTPPTEGTTRFQFAPTFVCSEGYIHSISATQKYGNKSHEELRLSDYQLRDKRSHTKHICCQHGQGAHIFGTIIPTLQPFGNNTTMPGFWPPIFGFQAPALEPSSGSYMLVGLVPVYCHIPTSVQPQSAPTGGTQRANGGVSSGIAAGFSPFANSVPPPTISPSNRSHCNCSQQQPPNNNTTYSTTTSNPTSVFPATTGSPFCSPFGSEQKQPQDRANMHRVHTPSVVVCGR